jgi:hypothetical protein
MCVVTGFRGVSNRSIVESIDIKAGYRVTIGPSIQNGQVRWGGPGVLFSRRAEVSDRRLVCLLRLRLATANRIASSRLTAGTMVGAPVYKP